MPDQHETNGRLPSLFREVNDELVRFSLGGDGGDGSIAVLCECGNCFAQLRVPARAYELARSKPGRQVLKDGHQPAGSRLVAAADGFVIAEP